MTDDYSKELERILNAHAKRLNTFRNLLIVLSVLLTLYLILG